MGISQETEALRRSLLMEVTPVHLRGSPMGLTEVWP